MLRPISQTIFMEPRSSEIKGIKTFQKLLHISRLLVSIPTSRSLIKKKDFQYKLKQLKQCSSWYELFTTKEVRPTYLAGQSLDVALYVESILYQFQYLNWLLFVFRGTKIATEVRQVMRIQHVRLDIWDGTQLLLTFSVNCSSQFNYNNLPHHGSPGARKLQFATKLYLNK